MFTHQSLPLRDTTRGTIPPLAQAGFASLCAILFLFWVEGCSPTTTHSPPPPKKTQPLNTPPTQSGWVATQPNPTATDPRFAPIADAIERGTYPQALDLCRDARAKKYPLGEILSYESDIFKGVGYLDKQMETLNAWAKVAPKDTRPLYALFYLYLDLGWMPDAEAISKKALQMAPDNARSWVTKALVAYRSSEPIQGVPAIQQARKLAPNDLEYANLHANLLMKALKFEEAERVLRDTLLHDPKIFKNRIALAQTLARLKKTPEAVQLLQALHVEEPNRVEPPYELGVIAYQQENYPEALKQFQSAALIESAYSNVLWYLGRTEIKQNLTLQGKQRLQQYEKLNSKTDAFETALARLKAAPRSAEAHLKVGRLQMEAEDFPHAIVEFRKALELRPQDAPTKQLLALALRKHGRITESEQIPSQSTPPRKDKQ